MSVLVVLQNMWGWGGYGSSRAPLVFRINPDNFSGRRLYNMLGDRSFYVTNSSSGCARTAPERLKPDPDFLRKAVALRPWKLYVVCGVQATETFKLVDRQAPELELARAQVVFMRHPAARTWTRGQLEAARRYLAEPPPGWSEVPSS